MFVDYILILQNSKRFSDSEKGTNPAVTVTERKSEFSCVWLRKSKKSQKFLKKFSKTIDKSKKVCYNKTIERTKPIPKQARSRSWNISEEDGRRFASDTPDYSSFYSRVRRRFRSV